MINAFSDGVLDGIAHSIGEAGEPLFGTILGNIMSACGMIDTSGESTKWKRLYHTFRKAQREDRCANKVGAFLEAALDPARWVSSVGRERYDAVRADVNRSLLTAGFQIEPDGKLREVRRAASLDEAHQRSSRLRAALERRGIHPRLLATCQRLVIKDENFFHAVFEATKSVAERLRQMSGCDLDGSRLVDETLECRRRPFPLIALNRYDSDSLQNEQKGIAHLIRGLFHAFRNVTAHEPAITWTISEFDALDMISTTSLIHRRLDGAVVTTEFQRPIEVSDGEIAT